ncbi:MAG: NUDIX domain-containing protein [Pleurocapsa sp.]
MNLKVKLENLSKKIYFVRLPKKRMGAGCLLFNQEKQLLILKPIYRDCWLLPGGVIEQNESPRQACIREVKEETGIECESPKLVCVDYANNPQKKLESVQFIFLAETVKDSTNIIVPKKEISAYQFCELNTAISMLGIHSQRRLQSLMPYLNNEQSIIYLENGQSM